MNKRKYITDETPTIVDYKNTRHMPRHEVKPLGLLRGFYIGVCYAVFCGLVIGLMLNAICRGSFLP